MPCILQQHVEEEAVVFFGCSDVEHYPICFRYSGNRASSFYILSNLPSILCEPLSASTYYDILWFSLLPVPRRWCDRFGLSICLLVGLCKKLQGKAKGRTNSIVGSLHSWNALKVFSLCVKRPDLTLAAWRRDPMFATYVSCDPPRSDDFPVVARRASPSTIFDNNGPLHSHCCYISTFCLCMSWTSAKFLMVNVH